VPDTLNNTAAIMVGTAWTLPTFEPSRLVTLLVNIEGIDGSGKGTQAARWLQARWSSRACGPSSELSEIPPDQGRDRRCRLS